MLRDFLLEYKNGVFDSVQGFLVFYKLDRPPKNATVAAESRASSVEAHTKPTILEKRRMQQKKQDKKSTASSVPLQNKVSAVRRVLWIVGVNIAIVFVINILMFLTELVIDDKNSMLFMICTYFRTMLIMPIFAGTRIISTLWFGDVANAAFRYRGSTSRSSGPIDVSRATSDFLHSIVVELVFLLQALLFAAIPDLLVGSLFISYLGWFASLIYMSLLHSLYSFEYMWLSKGIFMNARLQHIERHWPYHLGFGSLLTLLTSLSQSFLFNSCVFGALFPFFIISSFLVEHDYPETKVGQFGFFNLALTVTNKLSLTVFKFVSPEAKNR